MTGPPKSTTTTGLCCVNTDTPVLCSGLKHLDLMIQELKLSKLKAAISLKDGGTINVLLLTVSLICEPLSCKPIAYTKQKYHQIAELELADLSQVGDELKINALFGSDRYW